MTSNETEVLVLGGDPYRVRPWLHAELADLRRWRQLENHGRWQAVPGGMIGEWLSHSPSLFFDQPIIGDYLWQVRVTRLKPDAAFVQRFEANNRHTQGCNPDGKYNFNFWLRADSPDDEGFLAAYPRHLGTGWNGMGDDYWRSLFTTVVWNPDSNWVRLRKSPGYVQVSEAVDVVPHLPYDEPHVFTVAVGQGRVRLYFDDRRVYDYADAALPAAGYIGLCVWLCVVRFDAMRLYEWI